MPALPEVDPRSVDVGPAGLAKAIRLLETRLAQGLHPGAQLAVFGHGLPVLDRHVGLGRQKPDVPVTGDTLFLIFSESKPFASVCVFRQIEEGKPALTDRVADHWPEFARNGKEFVTMEHVLTHRVGIPVGPGWRSPGTSWTTPIPARAPRRSSRLSGGLARELAIIRSSTVG